MYKYWIRISSSGRKASNGWVYVTVVDPFNVYNMSCSYDVILRKLTSSICMELSIRWLEVMLVLGSACKREAFKLSFMFHSLQAQPQNRKRFSLECTAIDRRPIYSNYPIQFTSFSLESRREFCGTVFSSFSCSSWRRLCTLLQCGSTHIHLVTENLRGLQRIL